MDPFTIGLLLQGGGLLTNLFGGLFGGGNDQFNQLYKLARGQMQQGPGQAEQLLLDWVSDGGQGFDPSHLFTGEGYNAGQDSLMQMLRAEPFDQTSLFQSLEPIESRALDSALADSFAQASGLGQRFGSAQMREEGRVRGEHAEGAAVRREGLASQAYESAQQRALQAGQSLQSGGIQEGQIGLQALLGLGGMGQDRQNANLQLLSLLFGGAGGVQSGAQQIGGFGQDLGGLISLIPLLQQLMGRGGQGGNSGGGNTGGVGMPGYTGGWKW